MRYQRADALCAATYVARRFYEIRSYYEIPEILEILVFGSTARGEQEVGDLDLLVIYRLTDECDYAEPVTDRFEDIEKELVEKNLAHIPIDFTPLSVSYFVNEQIRKEYRRHVFRNPDFVENALAICLRWNREKHEFCPSNLAEIDASFSQLPASA